ncbi:MAG: Tol-Pal system beta propeller repeat protein TolB [Geobacteraceae bacterium]|nr:Tol-Pal system beta propeller repeat protein TolB [Geobacteraceae bacterium]
MISKIFCSLFLLLILLLPAAVFGQEDFLRVTAAGNRQLILSILPPKPLSGELNSKVAGDITEIFKQDLAMTGIYQVIAEEQGNAPFTSDLLLKAGYTVAATSVTFEFRLVELPSGKELLAKRYSSSTQDIRRVVHTFSDEILQTMTGERGPFASKLAYVSTATGNKEIYLMDWDGYNGRKLTANGSINLNPDFSPSGKELVFTSYKNGNPDLYRRELFTGTEARISSAPGINITGAYSPEGNRIALAMSKDGNSEIYLITKEGKQLARLTNNPAIDLSPTWSPDGKFIAFVSDRLGKPQLFMMRFDGSEVRRLTTSGAYNVSPRWSPKGDKIVYCRQYGSGFQIHLINPDGSDDKQITFEGNNEHPRWSVDGRFIVFGSKRNGSESIYVMRADGSGQMKTSRGSSKDSHPTWSPRW